MPYAQALRPNLIRAPVSKPIKLPAPVKGWYTASSIAEAPEETALICQNWFCEPDALRVRKGFQRHTFGQGANPVESLVIHTDGTQTGMFSVANERICDVSVPGFVPTAVVTGLTNNRFQFINFAAGGGAYLVMVNGADDVINYDGTTWTTTSGITGVTGGPESLINVFQYKERLWFVQDGTTDVWYLPVNAISGTANKLACGALLDHGGKLIAGINWSVADAGTGKDDLLALISDQGELLIFTGTDPADAAAWNYIGNYHVGKPLGYRCFFKVGGDVLIICDAGILPISKVVNIDKAVFSKNSLTTQFWPDWSTAVRRYGRNFGWQMVTLPGANMAILNVPTVEDAEAEQFVWNVATGAPSKFTGLNAVCWAQYNDEIYFGGGHGRVYKAETGANDAGANIVATLLPAYDDLGSPAIMKHIKLVKALYETNVLSAPEIAIAVDYGDPANYAAVDISTVMTVFTWDVTPWDTAPWLGAAVYRPWQSGNTLGSAISPATRVTIEGGGAADDLVYRLFAWHLAYEDGGIVG